MTPDEVRRWIRRRQSAVVDESDNLPDTDSGQLRAAYIGGYYDALGDVDDQISRLVGSTTSAPGVRPPHEHPHSLRPAENAISGHVPSRLENVVFYMPVAVGALVVVGMIICLVLNPPAAAPAPDASPTWKNRSSSE